MLSRNDMTVLMQQVDVGKALDLLRHTTFGIEPTRRPARGMPVDRRTDGIMLWHGFPGTDGDSKVEGRALFSSLREAGRASACKSL